MTKCRNKAIGLWLAAALWLLLPVVALAAPWNGTADTGWYAEGKTEFEITTPEQLAGISKLVEEGVTDFAGVTVKIGADMDLGGVKGANGKWGGRQWRPICPGYGNEFTGVLDGDGHKIYNLYQNANGEQPEGQGSCYGLFGMLCGEIRDLTIESGYISAGYTLDKNGGTTLERCDAGAFAGYAKGGAVLRGCTNNIEVKGLQNTGGIVGRVSGATLIACQNNGSIAAEELYSGGLVGDLDGSNERSFIYACANTGAVSGGSCVGGLCGVLVSSSVTDCYSTGSVTATEAKACAGGLIGAADEAAGRTLYSGRLSSIVANCYAAGDVKAPAADGKTVGLFCGSDVMLGGAAMAVSGGKTPAIGIQLDKDDNVIETTAKVEVTNKAALQSFFKSLGNNFAEGGSQNGGLPVLLWQKGQAVSAEPEVIKPIDIIDITSTSCTVVFDVLPRYTNIELNDNFVLKATMQPQGELVGLETSLAWVRYNGRAAVGVKCNFLPLGAGRNVTFLASYKGSEECARSQTMADSGNWQDHYASAFAGGSGTAADPYQIATPEQLAYLAHLENVLFDNSYASHITQIRGSKYYWAELTADLDMSRYEWQGSPFFGHLDGKNHTISGLHGNALFSKINGMSIIDKEAEGEQTYRGSAVINLNFVDCTAQTGGVISANLSGGSLINCHIKNCTVDASKSTERFANYAGGLVGYLSCDSNLGWVQITGCSVTDCTLGNEDTSYAGGLVAYFNNGNGSGGSLRIKDCSVSADFNGSYIGGLIGNIYYIKGLAVENCTVDMRSADTPSYVGGIAGYVETGGSKYIGADGIEIKNCVISGSVPGAKNPDDADPIMPKFQILFDAGTAKSAGNYITESFDLAGVKAAEHPEINVKTLSAAKLADKGFWQGIGYDFADNAVWQFDAAAVKPSLRAGRYCRAGFLFVQQPQNTTLYVNRPAYMAVKTVGGLCGYTYQWQKLDKSGWTSIKGANANIIELKYADKYAGGTKFRCLVRDVNGVETASATASLSVVHRNVDIKLARDILAWQMMADGSLDKTGEAFALMSAGKDPKKLQYNAAGSSIENMLDCYPLGLDPADYTYTEGLLSQNKNFFAYIEDGQNAEKGNILSGSTNTVDAFLAMEMYFHGKDWGFGGGEDKKGRGGALDYLFGEVTQEENGPLFYTLNKMYEALGYSANGKFVQLLARIKDDPVYGAKAQELLPQILGSMITYYNNCESGAEGYKPVEYVDSMAEFVSALSAGSGAVNDKALAAQYRSLAARIINDKILTSQAVGGGYSSDIGNHDLKASANTTVAVLQALADYVSGSSALADYSYDIPGEIAVKAELDRISFPISLSGDLNLPTKGVFDTTLSWQSSDPSAISAAGKVTRRAERQEVTLTVTAQKGGASATRVFPLVIRAAGADDRDDVDEALAAAMEQLARYEEVINSIELPKSSVKGVAFNWQTSDDTVIAADGTVKRPAAGQEDKKVTLTLTAAKGGASATVTKELLVYAASDLSNQEGKLRETYLINRTGYMAARATDGYWDAWAAYAVLGDYIADPANGFDNKLPMPQSDWYGTQYGAMLLGICAIGENPYNYKDMNWVELANSNYGGPWAASLYSALGMEAAGADPTVYKSYNPETAGISASGMTQSMGMGIDIAGWAAVELANHLGTERTDAYCDYFVKTLRDTKGMDKDGNFAKCNYISTGCGVMGLAALSWAGVEEADPLGDQWKNSKTGLGPIDALYDTIYGGKAISGYGGQICVSLGDLYSTKYLGGKPTWLSVGVSRDKLNKQIALAEDIIADGGKYTPESLSKVEQALQVVKALPEARLAAHIPDWGKEYYDLYDAVRFAELQK